MNNPRTLPEPRQEKEATTGSWPYKLSKALIAMGVIAFGLIVTDRMLEAFRADDAPAVAAVENDAAQNAADNPSAADKIQPEEHKSLAELQSLIGTRIVFVSTAEPGYLVTEDEQRFLIDDAVDDETTLSSVTTHQIILESGGDLKYFSLTEPVVQ